MREGGEEVVLTGDSGAARPSEERRRLYPKEMVFSVDLEQRCAGKRRKQQKEAMQ
jgi:hypothetical protein